MTIRKTTLFLCICCCLMLFLVSGCDSKEERAVRKAVDTELNQLKDSDKEIAKRYLQTEDIAQLSQNDDRLSDDITQIFKLFYKNFSYKTEKITITENRAVVHTNLKIIDSKKLAKDFARRSLKKSIEQKAVSNAAEFSASDSYDLLRELLESKTYKTESVSADISLKKKGEHWTVIHTSKLDDILTGNFFSYITSARLLSPSEIVKTHFDTIKNFDSEQLQFYLSLDALYTEDSDNNALILAVTEQIDHCFDFKIKGETIDGTSATVQTTINSVDFQSILQNYQQQLSQWLKTSEALSGGAEGRRQKEYKLLRSCIEKNKAVVSHDVEIPLINDGINWKIQMTPEISQAVFGDVEDTLNVISGSPVS